MFKLSTALVKLAKLKPGLTIVTTTLSVIGGVLGIKQYRENHPKVDMTGQWSVETTVTRSDLKRYEGLHLTFRVFLRQQGNRVSGNGEKWTENGKVLPPSARSQVTLEGTIDGDVLHLTYVESGLKRSTLGQYDLQVKSDGLQCDGLMTGTAANASCATTWERRAQF